jgi:hypothetical protein
VRFARLGSITVRHLYNLRNCVSYRTKRIVKNRTVPGKAVKIGARKAPASEGGIGFNRVHQSDRDGVKGVFHINAIKCVTQ